MRYIGMLVRPFEGGRCSKQGRRIDAHLDGIWVQGGFGEETEMGSQVVPGGGMDREFCPSFQMPSPRSNVSFFYFSFG